jgi:hypothetical protein
MRTIKTVVLSDHIAQALRSAIRRVRALAPQLALALVVPGGFVLAILLWLHRRREEKLRRDGSHRVDRCRGASGTGTCAWREV